MNGGLALAFGLVKGLGIRCLENQGGWPEWLLVPGLVLAGVAVVLVRSDAWEGARLRWEYRPQHNAPRGSKLENNTERTVECIPQIESVEARQ